MIAVFSQSIEKKFACVLAFISVVACTRAPVPIDEDVTQPNPAPSAPATGTKTPGGNNVGDDNPTQVTSTSNPYNLCAFTWEKKPGVADYTTINWWAKAGGESFGGLKMDRTEKETFQGNPAIQSISSDCQRAQILKRCFELSVVADEKGNAPKLIKWMKEKKLNPVLVKMAFSRVETHLGTLHDSCVRTHSGPSCNGIGLMQIITAIAPAGEPAMKDGDKRWAGIHFNILTNLAYSSRIMERKLPATSLKELASNYNGNPNLNVRSDYSVKVPQWYHKLEACKL